MSNYRVSQAGKRLLGDTTAMTASHLPQSEAAHRMDLRSEVGPVVISYCQSDVPFTASSIIGCGIDFSENRVFYTKDGSFLGMVFDNVGKDCDIYPSVGLCHAGDAIRVNFGHESFKFDIEYHVQQQRNQTWAKILSTPLKAADIGVKDQVNSQGEIATEEQLRVPINRLVLSYLTHHGYARTARLFQAQCGRRKTMTGEVGVSTSVADPAVSGLGVRPSVEMAKITSDDQDMDVDGIVPKEVPVEEDDIELRTRIVNSVVAGDVDTALTETDKHYPTVFESDAGLMFFKLRCRKFVELILEAAELKKRMKAEELEMAVEQDEEQDDPPVENNGFVDMDASDMDIDDDAFTVPTTNGLGAGRTPAHAPPKRKQPVTSLDCRIVTTAIQYEKALNTAITYGQTLQNDYKTDSRPEVKTIFKRTFGIVAYVDPMEAGDDVTEIVGQEARVKLANEMNQAILSTCAVSFYEVAAHFSCRITRPTLTASIGEALSSNGSLHYGTRVVRRRSGCLCRHAQGIP
jgi:hypothetical protein